MMIRSPIDLVLVDVNVFVVVVVIIYYCLAPGQRLTE